MRVLVAEDDTGLRSVLERGLRENGYSVDAVGDGELALRYIETYEYEVAILDWRMPKVSGLEVTQRVRRRGSALPILMLTARDTARDRVTGLDEGADDYLVKPFDFSELLARVRALQRRGEALQSIVIKVANLSLDSITREVSIGKASSTTSRAVLKQVLIESIVLAGLGGLIGIGVGIGLIFLVQAVAPAFDPSGALAGFTPVLSAPPLVAAFAISIMIGLIAGCYPAYRATRVPIQPLRYQ